MTVGDLIALLARLPPQASLVFDDASEEEGSYEDVEVEFNQNGANSGDLLQQFTVTSDKSGKFSLTQKAYISSACLVGVTAWDGAHSSNDVNVNTTGKGCSGAKLAVDPCRPVCTDFATTGSGFTPGADIDIYYQFYDPARGTLTFTASATGCGTLVVGHQIKAPDGQLLYGGACNGFIEHSDLFCHADTVYVWAYDLVVDYATPTLAIDPRC